MGNTDAEVDRCCAHNPTVKLTIVQGLYTFLHQNNGLVRIFKIALNRMSSDSHIIVIRSYKTPAGEHERRFNSPTIDEVATDDSNGFTILFEAYTISRAVDLCDDHKEIAWPVVGSLRNQLGVSLFRACRMFVLWKTAIFIFVCTARKNCLSESFKLIVQQITMEIGMYYVF